MTTEETEVKDTNEKSSSSAATHPATTSRFANARRVSDVIESGLWPDLPQRDLKDMLDVDVMVIDVRFLSSNKFPDPETGKPGPYAIVKLADAEGEEFTTACGGRVVLEKLHELKDKPGGLPIVAAWKVIPSGRFGHYYDIA